jgi:predicted DNA-binding transcriptional regulator AlpA
MKHDESDDDLLLIREVAELARQPVSTIRWLRHVGKGPEGFVIGRRLVFRRSAVRAWIREREQAGAR